MQKQYNYKYTSRNKSVKSKTHRNKNHFKKNQNNFYPRKKKKIYTKSSRKKRNFTYDNQSKGFENLVVTLLVFVLKIFKFLFQFLLNVVYLLGNFLYRVTKEYLERKKKIKVLLAHDNRTPLHTTKAHKLAEFLDNNPNYDVIYDKKVWNKYEKTTNKEDIRRENRMVEESDLILRIVPNPSKTKKPRNKGAVREIRGGMQRGKPVIEMHETGAKESPYKPKWEKSYSKREAIYLKSYERLSTAFFRGVNKLKRKKIL